MKDGNSRKASGINQSEVVSSSIRTTSEFFVDPLEIATTSAILFQESRKKRYLDDIITENDAKFKTQTQRWRKKLNKMAPMWLN